MDNEAIIKTYTKSGDVWGSAPLIDETNINVPRAPEFVMTPIQGGVTRSTPVGAAEMAPPSNMTADVLDKILDKGRGKDAIPPTRVLDLEIDEDDDAMIARMTTSESKSTYTNSSSLKLRWTAPWDDVDAGRINKFLLKLSLDENNEKIISVTAENSVDEEIIRETIDLRKVNLWQEGEFDVKAEVFSVDNAGNESPASNPVSMQFGMAAPEPPTPTPSTQPPTDNKSVIIAVSVVVVAVALAAAFFGVALMKKKRARIASRKFTNEESGL